MTVASKHFKWHHLIIGILISFFLMILSLVIGYYTNLDNKQITLISYFIVLFSSTIFLLMTKKFRGESLKAIRKLGIVFIFISSYFAYLIFLEFFNK